MSAEEPAMLPPLPPPTPKDAQSPRFGSARPSNNFPRDGYSGAASPGPRPTQHSPNSSFLQDPEREWIRAQSFEDPARLRDGGREDDANRPHRPGRSWRGVSRRLIPRSCPDSTEYGIPYMDSVYDDDFLAEDRSTSVSRPCWRTLHAVFILTQAGRKIEPKGKFNPLAGHAENFRCEGGYVLKALTLNENATLESLQSEARLKTFAPQYLGCVEREGRTFIRMQDVMLSMPAPNYMDVKMGLRSFAESEVASDKRRMDLLKKALVIQENNPSVYITEDEKQKGISKHRFMSLRDHASSSATLGFRVQAMMRDKKALVSKDFASHRAVAVCRTLFRDYFKNATPVQRVRMLERLRELHRACAESPWFAWHEVIGSSLLIGYDTLGPEKCGLWMIDFARTEACEHRIYHDRPWVLGSREDGYLVGLQSLIYLWQEELEGVVPLNDRDWHYRAEGHDWIVLGNHGQTPELQGKVLLLAKEIATERFRITLAGHPAIAYNDFVATMLQEYLGSATDPGRALYVERPFLENILARIEPGRVPVGPSPLDRLGEYQLLMEDAAVLPGCPRDVTLCMELRLQAGHVPPPVEGAHWLKPLVSRYAMQQALTHGEDPHRPPCDYCPLDFFSGDFDRTRNALARMLAYPRNLLRITLGDNLLVPTPEGVQDPLENLLGGAVQEEGGSARECLADLIARGLCRPHPQDQAPLLVKIRTLQRLGLDIETLWPRVEHYYQMVTELQQIHRLDPIGVGPALAALAPCPPLHCHSAAQRRRRGLPPPTPARLRAHLAEQQAARAEEVQQAEDRMQNLDPALEIRKLLLSRALEDAVLMVSLAPLPENDPDPNGDDVFEGAAGRQWRMRCRLVGLEAPSPANLPQWYAEDRALVRAYEALALGTPPPDTAPPVEAPPALPSVATAPPHFLSPALRAGPAPPAPIRAFSCCSPYAPIETADLDKILQALACPKALPNLEREVEELLRSPDRLPSLSDAQIAGILGLTHA